MLFCFLVFLAVPVTSFASEHGTTGEAEGGDPPPGEGDPPGENTAGSDKSTGEGAVGVVFKFAFKTAARVIFVFSYIISILGGDSYYGHHVSFTGGLGDK